jgi:hypothetical protein
MKGRLLAGPWAVSVLGGVVMTSFTIVFAVAGNWEAAAASTVAALYAGLAGRQTAKVVILAGALAWKAREDDERYPP